jgi:hypothetical protein
VSFQITILKVLAGHPEGRASLADLRRYLGILMSSGADWADRMKRLAARAADLDIFSQSFVVRNAEGWEITDAVRAFLVSLEAPISVTSDIQKAIADNTQSDRSEVVAVTPPPSPPPTPLLLIGSNRRRPRRGRFVGRTRRSA